MLFRTPSIFPLLYPRLTWRVPTVEKKIYLTFDDGPIPGTTHFVLDQLRKFNALATFFCIGNNVVEHSAVFEQVRAAGHAIGNHTFNHMRGWGNSTEAYYQDVEKCREVIGSTTLFRPPYGRITRAQISRLAAYKICMWDVLSFDYASATTPERCLTGTIKATRPGSIIVFHDSYKAEKNLTYALPRFLDHFSGHGFVFESLHN